MGDTLMPEEAKLRGSSHEGWFCRLFEEDLGDLEAYQAYERDFRRRLTAAGATDFFAGWKLPLMPFVLGHRQMKRVEADLASLLSLICGVTDRFFGGDWRKHGEFLNLDPGYLELYSRFRNDPIELVARPDCVLTGDSFLMLEANIGTGIGGMEIAHIYLQLYRDSPLLLPLWQGAVAAMDPLQAFGDDLARAPEPLLMIGSTAVWEDPGFMALQMDALRRRVPEVIVAGPAQCSLRAEGLFVGGRRMNSLYFDTSIYQMHERAAELRPLIEAAAAGAIELIYPPSTILATHKVNLAVLSEASEGTSLTPEERSLVRRCVPWTRVVDAATARQLEREPARYVLKKGSSRGSRDVCIGRDVDRSHFDRCLARACQEKDWVAQELVAAPTMLEAFLVGGQLRHLEIPFLFSPFFFHDKVVGVKCLLAEYSETDGGFLASPGYRSIVDTIGVVDESSSGPVPPLEVSAP